LDSQVTSAFSSPLILPKNAKDVLVSRCAQASWAPTWRCPSPASRSFRP
jgi:hypothetical protein